MKSKFIKVNYYYRIINVELGFKSEFVLFFKYRVFIVLILNIFKVIFRLLFMFTFKSVRGF